MHINIGTNNVTGSQHIGTSSSFGGPERLIEFDWDESTRTWMVKARADGQQCWSVWTGDENDLDELMTLARDTVTGG